MPFLIQDLFLAGAVGGLNCLLYAQMQWSTPAATENWFYCVEKGRPGGSWLVNQIDLSHYPKTRQLIYILVEKRPEFDQPLGVGNRNLQIFDRHFQVKNVTDK